MIIGIMNLNFFGTKKKSEKVRIFFTQRSESPPSSRFFEKIPDVIFLRPQLGKMNLIKMLNLFQPIEFSLSKFDRLDPSYQTSKARIR